MTRKARLAALVLAAVATACATTQARGTSAGPPLETPVPPPHVVQPLPDEPGARLRPDSIESVKEAPAPRHTPAKPDSPDPASPGKPEAPAQPPLQTTPNVLEMEKLVRALIEQAERDLDRTDYRKLNADGRTAYETAKRFVRQAETALEEKDVTFAEQLARKAATLAASLIVRGTTGPPLSGETMPA